MRVSPRGTGRREKRRLPWICVSVSGLDLHSHARERDHSGILSGAPARLKFNSIPVHYPAAGPARFSESSLSLSLSLCACVCASQSGTQSPDLMSGENNFCGLLSLSLSAFSFRIVIILFMIPSTSSFRKQDKSNGARVHSRQLVSTMYTM